jgi:hypothetical protein
MNDDFIPRYFVRAIAPAEYLFVEGYRYTVVDGQQEGIEIHLSITWDTAEYMATAFNRNTKDLAYG